MSGIALLVVCLAFSGLSIPLVTIEDGVAELATQQSRELAEASFEMAEIMMDHPIEKLVFPASRLESIRYQPGSCPPGDPGGHSPSSDWVVTIRYYTFFAIPGPRVVVRCGGHSARRKW